VKKIWSTALIILGSLALLGIIVVQLSWIRNALSISQESFNTAVNSALATTVDQLEKKEDILFITEKIHLNFDSLAPPPPPLPQSQGMPRPSHDGRAIDSVVIIRQADPEMHERVVTTHEFATSAQRDSNTLKDREIIVTSYDRIEKKVRKMNDVIREIVVETENKNLGIESRLDTFSLLKELNKALSDNGIHHPYEFAVVSQGKPASLSLRSRNFKDEFRNMAFKVSLFPNDLIPKQNFLLVYFPGQQSHLFKSMSLWMISSLIFTLTMLVVFIVTILALLKQKKISDIKTDFINNMTHELKTPLATISLAVDSINNPRVIEDPALIRNYTQVIREENARMNTHVEQVLQMALFDRREFKFEFVPVDMHDLLKKAVESIRLQVEKKQGYITLDLQASTAIVQGDEVHLLNCMLNLLDNANKYSPEKPEITIYTKSNGQNIILGFSDKGVGMTRETQKRIFEKFYRIPTGNIHNVKGFGLGLSYAKAIVDAHRGAISVSSEAGVGSRIEISLPLHRDN
jgi:signal transduction histidine kinase